MRKTWARAGCLLLGMLFVRVAPAQGLTDSEAAVACGRITAFDPRSQWARLPKRTRVMLRRATLPRVEAIVADPGMGLMGVAVDRVPLAAVEVGRLRKGVALYAVSWRERTFGVNGAVWLVEVARGGAIDRTPKAAADRAPVGVSGFGVAVLPTRDVGYPELVTASKGYKAGGGSEAEADCWREVGSRYREMVCPARCQEMLNQR